MQRLRVEGRLLFAEAYISLKSGTVAEPVDLLVDTGAYNTIIETSIIEYLGYSASDAHQISALDGAAGTSEGYMIRLPSFKCLGFTLNNFDVACHDIDSQLGIAGLLGMNFLQNFRLDIDFSDGSLHRIERVVGP